MRVSSDTAEQRCEVRKVARYEERAPASNSMLGHPHRHRPYAGEGICIRARVARDRGHIRVRVHVRASRRRRPGVLIMVEPAWLGSVSIRKGGWRLCRHRIGDLPAAVWAGGEARVGPHYQKWQAGVLLAWVPTPFPFLSLSSLELRVISSVPCPSLLGVAFRVETHLFSEFGQFLCAFFIGFMVLTSISTQ